MSAVGIQSHSERRLDPFLTGRTYTVAEAARLAPTSSQTVWRWLRGSGDGQQDGAAHNSRPPSPAGGKVPAVSFLELVEIVIVAGFRRDAGGRRVPTLARIQRAHGYLSEKLGIQYPFASLDLLQRGGRVLHDFEQEDPGPGAFTVDVGNRHAFAGTVEDELRNIDYEDGVACRWFPLGREAPIVIDPFIAAGFPTVAGTGVTVRTIQQRHKAGESAEFIAGDYEIDTKAVEQALHFSAA